MGEVVNLRQVRKRATRNAREAEAEINRVQHGTPKHLRLAVKQDRARARQTLDGHRLNGSSSEPSDDGSA